MKRQVLLPSVLQRRIWFLLIIGTGCLLVAGAIFFISHDRILLSLSVLLFLASLWKALRLRHTAVSGNYETLIGVCTGITSVPFRRYRKYHITAPDDTEHTLLLEKHIKIKLYVPYCFYFGKDTGCSIGNEHLSLLLSTDHLLGFEELSPFLLNGPSQNDTP